MFRKSYSADQQLEIIILGAMRGMQRDTSKNIREAIFEISEKDRAK